MEKDRAPSSWGLLTYTAFLNLSARRIMKWKNSEAVGTGPVCGTTTAGGNDK